MVVRIHRRMQKKIYMERGWGRGEGRGERREGERGERREERGERGERGEGNGTYHKNSWGRRRP